MVTAAGGMCLMHMSTIIIIGEYKTTNGALVNNRVVLPL